MRYNMEKEEVFVSVIDPTYSVKCWKGTVDITYAFQVRSSNQDMFGDPVHTALPANEVPAHIVAELRPLAFDFLGVEYINDTNQRMTYH